MSNNLFKITKRKEEYKIQNLTSFIGYYSVIKSSCNGEEEIANGNIQANDSFMFIPTEDGDYIFNINLNEVVHSFIITYYPTLLKSVIKDTEKALCNCGCGCEDNNDDCVPKEAKQCLENQNIYSESQLLLSLIKTITNCKENYNLIKDFISESIRLNKCNLFSLFCSKELEVKIKGKAKYNNSIQKKLISINYLALYYYEKQISDTLPEFVSYVNEQFNYNIIKDCILKAGIDVLQLETLFSSLYYDNCYNVDDYTPVCSIGCFTPMITPNLHIFNFNVNDNLNGIYHTVSIKNTCIDEQLFVNKTIYEDSSFKVKIKNKTSFSTLLVQPGQVFDVDIIFIGTKTVSNILNIPFIYETVLINTYKIFFNEIIPVVNNSPTITDIVKVIENRTPYDFTVADFENHFTDIDGDTLDKIVLIGDTSRFTLDSLPYQSGTVITKQNITKLRYTPLDSDTNYDVILNWTAYDSRGAESN